MPLRDAIPPQRRAVGEYLGDESLHDEMTRLGLFASVSELRFSFLQAIAKGEGPGPAIQGILGRLDARSISTEDGEMFVGQLLALWNELVLGLLAPEEP